MKPVYLYMYESEEKGQKEKKRNTLWTLTIYVVIPISYSLTHIKLLKINSGERNKRISHLSCSYGGLFFPRVTQQHSEISSSGSIDNVYYIICIYIYIIYYYIDHFSWPTWFGDKNWQQVFSS